MHIVNWNSDKYNSIAEAAVEPAGLAVLGILFEVTNVDNPAFAPLVNVLKHVRDPGIYLIYINIEPFLSRHLCCNFFQDILKCIKLYLIACKIVKLCIALSKV